MYLSTPPSASHPLSPYLYRVWKGWIEVLRPHRPRSLLMILKFLLITPVPENEEIP